MSQLSPLDGVFLSMDTPETPAVIGGLAILDPNTCPEAFDHGRFVEFASERLALCPRFGWKVAEVPLGLDLPYWVKDEELRVEHHIRRVAVPSPGGAEELSELAGHLFSMPLDRSRPLWEMVVIEGLQGGRVALLWKLHHCMMDGESGAGLVELLFDLAPEPAQRPLVPQADAAAPGEAPSLGTLIRNGFANTVERNRALARNAVAAVSALVESARSDEESVTAPRVSLNGVVSARRAIAWARVPLAHVIEIKQELGVSVNDVILGITGGAMRRYLEDRGELPEETLYASMPISTRAKGDKTVGNQVRDASVDWGTDVVDPVERVLRINASTRKVKSQVQRGGPSFIQGAAESFIPGATRLFMRASAAAADRIPLPANCVVSNVRMTDFPLYIAGAKIVGMVPMSMLAPTQGVNITVVTYDGDLHFGVIADPRLCEQPWHIADGVGKSLVELQEAMDSPRDAVA